MDPLTLSRWQFALTTSFHFLFVPLSIGLSLLVAVMESLYVVTKKDVYLQMTKFWGNFFLVSVALGVVTGIVLEFQFGLNWAEFSRYVGDIFGPPLAIESWVAFFLESVFIGVWIYGWKKLSPKVHLFSIWMVAFGSMLSAFWIISANAFMQEPMGHVVRNGRVELVDFGLFLQNPQVHLEFWHTVFACIVTTAFFVMSVSAYHLWKKSPGLEVFFRSLKMAALTGLVALVAVVVSGDLMAKHLAQAQPMKLAAAEALWETESPAGLSLFAIPDETNRRNYAEVEIPRLLSFLANSKFSGPVRGISEVQKELETRFGPGNYIPPVTLTYWAFRIMIFAGIAMLALLLGVLFSTKGLSPLFLKSLMWALPLPYLANTTGWILTEVGRQPWVVYTLMKTTDGVSANLDTGNALAALILFTLVYGVLSYIAGSIMVKLAKAGVNDPNAAKGGY